jgi:multidrug efflux pump
VGRGHRGHGASARPILLTAAAAILGMIPIAPTVFWGPMAYAVIGGLMVATLLTLVFLPALYVAWFRIQPAQTTSECNSGRDSESEVAKIVIRLKTISAPEAISAPEPALH